jgi:hypothetical protein
MWFLLQPSGTIGYMAKVYRPRVPVELARRIDAVRGDVPFERWVARALEEKLGIEGSVAARQSGAEVGLSATVPFPSPPAGLASPRASGASGGAPNGGAVADGRRSADETRLTEPAASPRVSGKRADAFRPVPKGGKK